MGINASTSNNNITTQTPYYNAQGEHISPDSGNTESAGFDNSSMTSASSAMAALRTADTINSLLEGVSGSQAVAGSKNALTTAMSQLRNDSTNPANKTQSQKLPDGRSVLFENVGGKAQFAVFNADGSQAAPSSGWQAIDSSVNNGKGTLALGNGQYMNFDMQGMTIDASVKNKGTPVGYDGNGNIGVGIGTEELSNASQDPTADGTISGGSVAAANMNLYPSNGTPSPSDIHQTELGDCYFDSTLASLASTPAGQQHIKNMIQPGSEPNTYDVTMYDPNGKPIQIAVDGNTETQNGVDIGISNGNNQADWGTILETAWTKYNDMYHNVSQSSGYQGIDHGGNLTSAYQALTGADLKTQATRMQTGSATPDELANYLSGQFSPTAASAGTGVTASSIKSMTLPDGVHVVGDHAYSVLGYDSSTQTVTVRNPWGANDGKNSDGTPTAGDGTIRMSLSDFQKAFGEVGAFNALQNAGPTQAPAPSSSTNTPSSDSSANSDGISPNVHV